MTEYEFVESALVLEDEDQPLKDLGVGRVGRESLEKLLKKVRAARATCGEIPREFEQGETEDRHAAKNTFEPDLFMEAFTAVRLRSDWTLDYVWRGHFRQGAPLLYARRKDEAPLRGVAEFSQRYGVNVAGWAPTYPTAFAEALEVDRTVRGAVELAVLVNEVPFFYWLWHALYDRVPLVVTPDQCAKLIREWGTDELHRLHPSDLSARVQWTAEVVRVELLAFVENEGFARKTFRFQLNPLKVLDQERRVIARTTSRRFY